jgi:hypothetical protein
MHVVVNGYDSTVHKVDGMLTVSRWFSSAKEAPTGWPTPGQVKVTSLESRRVADAPARPDEELDECLVAAACHDPSAPRSA